MFLKNKFGRNLISIALVLLFGFSALLNLFSNRNVVAQVGKHKIKVVDLVEMGAHDEKSFKYCLSKLLYINHLFDQADSLGIVAADADVKEGLKQMFSNNGEFDQQKLNQYLASKRLTKNGLIKLIKAELLERQIFSLIEKGIRVPDSLGQAVLRGLNAVRSGYIYSIDIENLSKDQVIQLLGKPTDSILTDFMRSKEGAKVPLRNNLCLVFKLKATDLNRETDLAKLTATYSYQEIEIVNNKCKLDLVELDLSELAMDNSTNLGYWIANGCRYLIYFNPMKNINREKVEEYYLNSNYAKVLLGRKLVQNEVGQLAKLDEASKKSYLKSNSPAKFKYFEGLSMSECFQNSRCKKCEDDDIKCMHCVQNDCMCEKCFVEDNKFNLSRPACIALLLTHNLDCTIIEDEKEVFLACPTNTTYPDNINEETAQKIASNSSITLQGLIKSRLINIWYQNSNTP